MDPKIIRERRPALVELAEWALEEGSLLIEPAVVQVEFDVEKLRHERLQLSGGFKLSGRLVAQHLAGAHQVIAMVCTLGPQLEGVSSELIYSDPLHALALEGFGTAAVEMLASMAIRRQEVKAQDQGLQTSIPLSPGMIDWPVEVGQYELFALVEADSIGVSLNSSGMMVPRLSLSQVIGVGATMKSEGRTCDYCNLRETCRYQDHYQA